jgi:uncharacterized protein YdaU (DUF1376 family)
VNFYSFHIGDYASKTRHLSWEEDMAYRRLLDVCYGTEKPLPRDKKAIYRLVVAQTAKQRQAVDAVLLEFFVEADNGYGNQRCDNEIKAFAAKREKAKQSAEVRWSNANASSDAMRTHSEGNAPITHYPLPNTQLDGIGTRDPLETKLREAAGWQSEPAPMLAVTGPIQNLIENGADLEIDVLPVVKALAPKVRGRSSWKYFLNAIAQARDDRIAAAKIVTHPNAMRNTNGPSSKPTRQDAFAILDAVADATIARTGGCREASDQADYVVVPRLRESPT